MTFKAVFLSLSLFFAQSTVAWAGADSHVLKVELSQQRATECRPGEVPHTQECEVSDFSSCPSSINIDVSPSDSSYFFEYGEATFDCVGKVGYKGQTVDIGVTYQLIEMSFNPNDQYPQGHKEYYVGVSFLRAGQSQRDAVNTSVTLVTDLLSKSAEAKLSPYRIFTKPDGRNGLDFYSVNVRFTDQ